MERKEYPVPVISGGAETLEFLDEDGNPFKPEDPVDFKLIGEDGEVLEEGTLDEDNNVISLSDVPTRKFRVVVDNHVVVESDGFQNLEKEETDEESEEEGSEGDESREGEEDAENASDDNKDKNRGEDVHDESGEDSDQDESSEESGLEGEDEHSSSESAEDETINTDKGSTDSST